MSSWSGLFASMELSWSSEISTDCRCFLLFFFFSCYEFQLLLCGFLLCRAGFYGGSWFFNQIASHWCKILDCHACIVYLVVELFAKNLRYFPHNESVSLE